MPKTEAYLAGIRTYPIKSLDPVLRRDSLILPGGALARDREFAILDAAGKYVNAKRFANVQRLRTSWNAEGNLLCLQADDTEKMFRFALPEDQTALEQWLSGYFEQPVTLARNREGGFPDDTKAPGPTIISTATLEEVASWYPGLKLEEARRRFRANLEVGGVPPFWEDRLYTEAGEAVPFRIGDALFHGVNPCQRCIVPTRDTQTAELWPDFSQTFREKREQALPDWANRARFNHFYRLAVNTCVPDSEAGKILRVGDILTV